jgi:hypothetical protein
MKRVILLVAALLLAHLQYAQDCTPSAPPYLEDFETVTAPAVPNCLTASSGGFTTVNNPGNGFTSNTLKYTGGAQASDTWLFTKGIHLEAGVFYRVNYKYGNLGTDVQTAQFGYSVNNDGTSFTITGGQVNVSDGALHSANFSYLQFPQTGTYYFGYHITSVAGAGSLLIDDISVQPSTCGIPGYLNASAVTQNSATITWEATTTGNVSTLNYQYVVSTSPSTPATGIINYSLNKALTDLQPATTYYVFVRSSCLNNLWSDWATTTFITLPCDAVAAPYNEDFETAIVPAAPQCTSAPVPPTGNGWVTANNPGNGFTNNTLSYTGTANAANAWFFTRGVQLTAGTYYQISYRYGNNGTGTTEKLTVARFTTPDPTSASSNVGNYTVTGGQPQDVLLNYVTVPVSGTYYFGFNAHSDASQGSLNVDDFNIEPSLCGIPANVTVVPGQTTATVNWGVPTNGNALVNVYQYAFGTTATPPTENIQYMPGLTTELTGLQPGTTYYAFTRSFCGQIVSEWTVTPFNTLPDCEAATVPYTIDFEVATTPDLPTCTYAPATAIAHNNWVTAGNPGSGFTTKALSYTGTADAANAWFFTQGIQLTGGQRYKVSFIYGNSSATTTEKLFVNIYSAQSSAATLPNFEGTEYTVTTGQPATQVNDYVTVPTTGVYYFGFNARSDASQGSLYLDDFSIVESICGQPADITVTGISQTGATVNWAIPTTGNSPVNVYQYAYGTTDTPPAQGEYIPTLTKEITGLTAGTTYYVFTRSACGPLFSDWTVTPFTTLPCDAVTVPYTLDFETTFVPAIPGCTYTAPVADGNNNWVTANNPGNGFTSNTLSYTATANAANAWFFTHGIQLEAGKYYKVSFTYGNNSTTTTEKLFVNQYSAPNSAATIPGFAGSEYTVTAGQPSTQVNDYVTVPTTGVYYFGFNAHSDASQGSLYIDDFSIVESVCGEPADVTVDNISQTGATVNWAIPNTGNSPVNVYQYAYDTTDTPPAEGEFISELTKDLTGLTPGTDYYVFTRSLCGQIFSEWTVTPFTTLDETAGLDDYTLSSLKVYPNPTKDVVRIANSNTIDKVDIYNITGQLILSQAINSQEAEINLQHLAAGAYFMNVQANGAVKKVKVIKQ